MAVKWIYLARRNPATSHEAFRPNWRSHSALASTFAATLGAHFTGVRQCAVVQGLDLPPEMSTEQDGVALLWMRSLEDLRASWEDPDAIATMHPDELRVFSDHIVKSSFYAQETVHRQAGDGRAVIVTFLKRRTGMSRCAFGEDWRDRHAALVLAQDPEAGQLKIYRQNTLIYDPPAGFDFDGVAEMWFETPADALAFARSPTYRKIILPDYDRFAEPGAALTVLAEVNLIKAEPGKTPAAA
jgi:hypothetical protein